MASQWFYQIMGDEVGPVSSRDLRKKVAKGDITPDSLIRKGEDGEWMLADKVYGLFNNNPTDDNDY